MVHTYLLRPGAILAQAIDRFHRNAHLALKMMENKMSDTGILESFPAMLRRVLGDRLTPDVTTFPDMFAPDGMLEYPYAPPGRRTPRRGRDAIVANFQIVRKWLRIDSVT